MSLSTPYPHPSASTIQDLIVPVRLGPEYEEDEVFPPWVTMLAPWEGEAFQPAAYFEHKSPRTNQSYLTDTGLQELANMLDSGAYQIDFPENAALMVVAHLLRLEKVSDARQLLRDLAPYMNRFRFFPTPTFYVPTFAPNRVCITNVGSLKKYLLFWVQHKRTAHIRPRDGCDLYEPIQAEAVKLLLASAGTALTAETDKLLLTQISEDLKADMKRLITRYWVINPFASDIVSQAAGTGTTRDPHPVSKHTRKNATTRVLIEALCSVFVKNKFRAKVVLCNEELSLVGNRIRNVIAKRGELGTPKHDEEYRARVELSSAISCSNIATFAEAAIIVLNNEHYVDHTFINEADTPALNTKIVSQANIKSSSLAAPRAYHGGTSPPGLPAVVASGISRATARTIEGHIQAGTITSAEQITTIIPSLFTASASNKIEDRVFRNLHCHMSLASCTTRSYAFNPMFVSRSPGRRNYFKAVGQVCLSVRPWAKVVLSDISDVPGAASDVTAFIDTINTATRAWINNFPYTPFNTQLVSVIKGVMRKVLNDTQLPILVKSIRADSFMGSLSSNFSLSTLQAARSLQGTLYERYYNIGPIYADLIARLGPHAARTDGGREGVTAMSGVLLEAATNCMTRWRANAIARPLDTSSANGRTLEAVMVMSTHNLCQLYAWLGLGNASPSEGGVDNMAAVRKTWKHIVGLFESPPEDTYYGYRMVAYAWRQLLFFLSMEEKRLTHADDADSIAAFRATMAALCDEMQQTIGTAKLTEVISERLSTKFVNVLRKVAAEGKVNTMESKSDTEKGSSYGDVVLGGYDWSMFDRQ